MSTPNQYAMYVRSAPEGQPYQEGYLNDEGKLAPRASAARCFDSDAAVLEEMVARGWVHDTNVVIGQTTAYCVWG
jgi:hypothetical protein